MKAFVIYQDQIKHYAVMLGGALVVSFVSGYFVGTTQFDSDAPEKSRVSSAQNDMNIAEKGAGSADKQEAAALSHDKSTTSSTDAQADKVKLAVDKSAQQQKAREKAELAKKELAKKELAKKEKAKKEKAKKELAKKEKAKKELAKKEKAKKELARKELAKKELARKIAEEEAQLKKTADEAGKKLQLTSTKESSVTTNNSQPLKSAIDPKSTTANILNEQVSTSKRVYSVQAGMFASKTNAMSFIGKLEEKSFDAYVIDFISSSGTTKYNVRVGRFERRDEARELLKEFQKSFSSPAYVVIAP